MGTSILDLGEVMKLMTKEIVEQLPEEVKKAVKAKKPKTETNVSATE